MTKDEYIEKYNSYFIEKYRLLAEDVYDNYYTKVYPFLSVITEFRIADESIRMRELATALYLSEHEFRAMKETFLELEQSLASKKSLMKFKSMLDVQRGIINTEYRNAKMLEMQSKRYDDEYNPNGSEDNIDIPKTIEVTIRNEKKSDTELKEYAPIDEE